MRKVFFFLLLMLLSIVASAHDFFLNGFYYNYISENDVAVTYQGESPGFTNHYSSDIIIPESIIYNGITYTVSAIGDYAFYYCSGVKSITIPNSITEIGNHAFLGCSGLTNIIIPETVTEIKTGTFYGCNNLAQIEISNSITSIGDYAFENCKGLSSVTIPRSVSYIGKYAFRYCSGLTSISFLDPPTIIGDHAFENCNGLTSVTIPNSVTSIGNQAFQFCSSLTSVTIGNSVISIGKYAFRYCNKLTSIVVANDNHYYDSRENCNALIETANNNLVVGCESTFIPQSVTSIGEYAFYNCSGLSGSLDIPNSVTYIGEYAFYNCSGLSGSLNIPSSVTCIGNSAFYNCSGLSGNLNIPNSVTEIGDYAFYSCSGLSGSLDIPNSVIYIGNYAFYGCSGLSGALTIPNSVTIIGEKAFYGCTGITGIAIPNSIVSIGIQAFYLCYNISTLMITGEGEWQRVSLSAIPTSPKLYIDSRITSLCEAKMPHSNVYCFATTPPECDENSFTSYSGTLHVPAASLAAYYIADYWSNFTDIVGDAVEPNITISQDSVEITLGDNFNLTATVTPNNATPNSITWRSTNTSIATVNNYGKVTSVGAGECDIIAECLYKRAFCHLVVNDTTVTITLTQHEAMLLPNHMMYITLIPNPIVPELSVISSDPSVAAARVSNGKIQVVGIKEGTTTITVGSVDGTAIPATCLVTVYTEPGDINCDGFVDISDVTSLIDYLLSGDDSQISTKNADVNGDEKINISDVTELIDYLLNGGFWPWEYETFNVNGVKFTMVLVKGGTFMMGATSEQGNDTFENEYPIHQVTLSDYMIGQTEVTQQLWKTVMGTDPSFFGGNPSRPVERVTWNQCQSFINKLNQLTGKTFRLPTEAEWEFAARGGNKSQGYKYSGSDNLDDIAWYGVSGGDWLNPKYGTHSVRSLEPNELRLYDMSGNVWEWCQDRYSMYSEDEQTNPTGPESGIIFVHRGGAWDSSATQCRSSYRNGSSSDTGSFYKGLRLAL